MVNFHVPDKTRPQVSFVFVAGWDPDSDEIIVDSVNNDMPEPIIIFCMDAWLKKFRDTEYGRFDSEFFPDEEAE